MLSRFALVKSKKSDRSVNFQKRAKNLCSKNLQYMNGNLEGSLKCRLYCQNLLVFAQIL